MTLGEHTREAGRKGREGNTSGSRLMKNSSSSTLGAAAAAVGTGAGVTETEEEEEEEEDGSL